MTLHVYELYLGRPRPENARTEDLVLLRSQTRPRNVVTSNISDLVQEGEFVRITDLDFKAKITSIREGTSQKPQPISLEIFNPSPEIIRFIQKDNTLVLKAGYDDTGIDTMCVCQIISGRLMKDGENTVARIIAGDSTSVKQGVYFANSYPPGTPYVDIFLDIVDAYGESGIPLRHFNGSLVGYDGALVDLPSQRTAEGQYDTLADLRAISRGYVFEGLLNKNLDTLCTSVGMRAYTVLGSLVIEPAAGPTLEEVIVLEEATLRKSIEVMDKKSLASPIDQANREQGIMVNVFLEPGVATATRVRISDGNFQGEYQVISVSMNLHYEGDVWDATFELRPIKDQVFVGDVPLRFANQSEGAA